MSNEPKKPSLHMSGEEVLCNFMGFEIFKERHGGSGSRSITYLFEGIPLTAMELANDIQVLANIAQAQHTEIEQLRAKLNKPIEMEPCIKCGCSYVVHRDDGVCPEYFGGEMRGWLDTVYQPSFETWHLQQARIEELTATKLELQDSFNDLRENYDYIDGKRKKAEARIEELTKENEKWKGIADTFNKPSPELLFNYVQDQNQRVEELTKALREATEWISVEERLPDWEIHKWVLVKVGTRIQEAMWSEKKSCWANTDWYILEGVTHWRTIR